MLAEEGLWQESIAFLNPHLQALCKPRFADKFDWIMCPVVLRCCFPRTSWEVWLGGTSATMTISGSYL